MELSGYSISATPLSGGNILVAYSNSGSGYDEYGTSSIYNSAGALVSGPIVFKSAGTACISSTKLNDGIVFVTYIDTSSAGGCCGTFMISDSSGNLSGNSFVFNSKATDFISAAALPNGNVFIAYHDAGEKNKGKFVIYDSSGNLICGPTLFNGRQTFFISATMLGDDNVLIMYQDRGNDGHTRLNSYVICGMYGNILSGPGILSISELYNAGNLSTTAMTDGNVFLAYRDSANTHGEIAILGSRCLQLQKVNSNEVRLWNFTGETQNLTLSANH